MSTRANYDVMDTLPPTALGKAVIRSFRPSERSAIERYLVGSGIEQGKPFAYFSYGRNALYALFREKSAGKEVIFPGFICPSLAMAAIKAGARPRFVDVSLDDFNLDASLLSPEVLRQAGALLVNHTFGVPAAMDKIRGRLRGTEVYLIEDVAQALFARYHQTPAGAWGDAVLMSMYKQVPNLNGAIIISEVELKEPRKGRPDWQGLNTLLLLTGGPHQPLLRYIRRRRRLSAWWSEQERELSMARPSRLALALFAGSLPALEDSVKKRRVIARHYQDRAQASRYLIPQQIDWVKEPSCFNFSVRLSPEIANFRDEVLLSLRGKGIFCDRLWHDSPVAIGTFKDYLDGEYPNSRLLARSVMNMPIKASYQEKDVHYLFNSIEEIISGLVR